MSDGAAPQREAASPRRALAAALLGFSIITLDALVVSVALPAIRDTLGGGITGLQWVMDGYTLPFAALLLLAGTLSDRLGARRAFGLGLGLFVLSSAACALSASLWQLIAARAAQGAGAALMTPASLALIGEAYPNPKDKARAIALWAVGGAVASASGPLVGGALTAVSWQLIFLVNLPIGAVALWLLAGVPRSPRQDAAFDWPGQLVSLVALVALIFGLVEAGERGLASPVVLCALAVGVVSGGIFFALQRRSAHPMVPLPLFRPRPALLSVAIGFTFMFGFYGMVFLMSLIFQAQHDLSALDTGLVFIPVTGFSIFMPVLAARLAERFGPRLPITLGQLCMVAGLLGLSAFAETASVTALVLMMIPVGLGGGLAMPSATSLLLNTVPVHRSGTASGVLNTSRQVGGATAIAAFGALIAAQGYDAGAQISFGAAGGLLLITATLSATLRRPSHDSDSSIDSAR